MLMQKTFYNNANATSLMLLHIRSKIPKYIVQQIKLNISVSTRTYTIHSILIKTRYCHKEIQGISSRANDKFHKHLLAVIP